jgi:hypothetical protein
MLGFSQRMLLNVKVKSNLTGAAGRETDTVVRFRNKNIELALNQLGCLLKHHMPSRQCQAFQRGVRGPTVVTDFWSLITGHGYLGG